MKKLLGVMFLFILAAVLGYYASNMI